MDRARIRSSSKGRRRAGVGVVAAAALAMFVFAAPATATGIDDRFQNIADPSAAPTWTLQINGAGASLDAATAVLADGSGAYIGGWAGNAAGNWDATLTRVSSTGVRKWLKRWDSSVHKNDLIWKLAKGPNGTVYGAGWTVAANDKTNILVIKWAADGAQVDQDVRRRCARR